jgi:chromosome segregation ATPase
VTDVSLEFIAHQLERVLAEQRTMREDLHSMDVDIRQIREDVRDLRDITRSIRGRVARLEDTITMHVLDRLRALETRDAR